MRIWIFFLVLVTFQSNGLARIELCSHVIIDGKDELEFSDTEKRMVCGDPKVKAYQNIPTYQASFFMKAFLQSKGHLNPEFETKDGVLHVDVGAQTEIKKISVASSNDKESEKV